MSSKRQDGRRHVLLLPSWYPSSRSPNNGTFFQSQAVALQNAGVKTGVIAPEVIGLRAFLEDGRPSTAILREDDEGVATYRKLTVAALPRFSRRNAWFWARAGKALYAEYVRDQGTPDLIHAHSALYGGILARDLARKSGIPYVISEHHSAFARGRLRPWTRRQAAQAFAAASGRFVVSPHLGQSLTAQFTDGFCPWSTVPNTLDPRFEQPLQRISRDPDALRLLCIGTFRKLKAQQQLIAAFAKAFHGDTGKRLRLGGAGPTVDDCRAHAHDLGVGEQVEFLGPLDREGVWRALMNTDLLIVPSYYETFGIVAIEALACGVPVVATRCGGPEGIVDDDNGLLVPPGDVDALADALVSMQGRLESYDPERLRRDCLDRFSTGAVSGQLLTEYESILSGAS